MRGFRIAQRISTIRLTKTNVAANSSIVPLINGLPLLIIPSRASRRTPSRHLCDERHLNGAQRDGWENEVVERVKKSGPISRDQRVDGDEVSMYGDVVADRKAPRQRKEVDADLAGLVGEKPKQHPAQPKNRNGNSDEQ